MRILVVEDDEQTANYLLRGLSESGHVVDVAVDGTSGLGLALEGIHDVLIVDRRLPGLDGIALVKALRARQSRVPVLMLSAQSSTRDKVEGLQAGCDDYLSKPYAFAEVLARLDALLRGREQSGRTLHVGELQLDCATRTAVRQGRSIALQHREALLLEKLMRHSGQVVTRDMLLDSAWDYDFDPNDNVIDKHIHRLRRKLDEGFEYSLIKTIPGAGYSFQVS
ncbi:MULTISPECIES: response regulator transcription factor [Pseudomonas]|uniref:DNA-binding response regulator n=1 Tax=Pseudomonas palleroniana TaxID=191390 RepID=A0A1H5PBI3_9PSED|nr:response regulator transcription factor [Pseudomonas palleroniana]MBM9489528.1 response regulator transcription factor [Pseudomonas sp. ICBG1301]AVE03179.1 DNA-binding response regulator [Pseudomonas palleroniana]KAB0564546.1 response regulator transcription factor [Pseudomonas palleroniana]PTC30892.1 DNA-binding response regulator [Pseudomonas palleroniana]SEF10397.1 two component transcriptional regulator, winged helix family [Pseudomonas palleroniana]